MTSGRAKFAEASAGALLIAIAALVALTFLFFLLAPLFTSNPSRVPAISSASESVVETAIATVAWTVGAGFLSALLFMIARDRKNETAAKVLGIAAFTIPILVFGLRLSLGLAVGLHRFLQAPSMALVRSVTLSSVTLTPQKIETAGVVALDAPYARVIGNSPWTPYLAVPGNVVKLTAPLRRVFTSNVGFVSDIELAGYDTLYAIVDRDLWMIKGDTANRVTTLPNLGMRFGRRVQMALTSWGLTGDLLLIANDVTTGKGAVYDLRVDLSYYKVTDTDTLIRGAAGCEDGTAIAFDEQVVLLRDGFHPRLLFRVPAGRGPVTSLAAGMRNNIGLERQCIWLVATADDVYTVQDGIATLIATGAGGNLTAPDGSVLDFGLTDPKRNAVYRLRIE